MKASELIKSIEAFIAEHGDLDVVCEYWCVDCHDTHKGKGIVPVYDLGDMLLEVNRLGE